MKDNNIMFGRIRKVASNLKDLFFHITGQPNPYAEFRRFLGNIHPATWQKQLAIYAWLDEQAGKAATEQYDIFHESRDPLVRLGYELRDKVLSKFRQVKATTPNNYRIAIFVPDYAATAAGHSWFMNISAGLEYLGIPVARWHQGTPIQSVLDDFRPTIILANDGEEYHPDGYLEYLGLNAIREYRKSNKLRIGLVASPYPKSKMSLTARLAHSRRLGIDFYYSFQALDFISRHHTGYRDAGFHVLTLEFGANPLVYYPVPGVEKDLDFVFLGSAHFEKWCQYSSYFGRVMTECPGFLVGSYWPKAIRNRVAEPLHRYAYSRARVGLNLHVPFQLEDATELNERAYNLAACGVPQLIDAPKLLPKRFRPGSVFVGRTPTEYADQFQRILASPEEARDRAVSALEDVLARHTVFHRAESLLEQLKCMEEAGGW